MLKCPEKFAGYVLAGGKSSRMKSDKAFLELKGETFLNRAVKTLSSVCENRVKIVLNKAQTNFIERLPERIPHIFDVYENRGALGGIHAALHDCQSNWAVILAVDLPFVTGEAIEHLTRIALELKDFSAIVPVQTDGRTQPLCAVYRVKECLPKIEKLFLSETSNAAKDFLNLVPVVFVEEIYLRMDKNHQIFFNVNKPTDFKLLEAWILTL